MQFNPKICQKSKTLKRFTAMILFAVLAITVQTFAQETQDQVITFDALGAGMGSGQGTVPRSIDLWGGITGEYYDSSGAAHGFVRAPNGTITTFDAQGASMANGQGTYPRSINPLGEIAGFYYDVSDAVVAESRQDSLQTIFSGRPDTLYLTILGRSVRRPAPA